MSDNAAMVTLFLGVLLAFLLLVALAIVADTSC